jgi:hypothetical protein
MWAPMRLLLAIALATGCVDMPGDDPGAGGKADGDGSCTDAKYGDGMCHVDLGCGIPDIDCYEVYADDDAATASATAAGIATLPTTDARYAKARTQLDKSWEMFKQHTPLGQLAEKHLGLVLVKDDTVNAYVYPGSMPGVAKFAVHIQSGLLDSAMTEDEFHGIMFHELTHLQKLHTSDEVYLRVRRYYVAPEGAEPIGASQIDHAEVREAFLAWEKAVAFSGVFTDDELAGLPYGGEIHHVFTGFFQNEMSRKPACSDAIKKLSYRTAEPKASYSLFYDAPILTPEYKAQSEALIAAVRACIGSDSLSFLSARQQLSGQLQSILASALTPADAALDGMPALDALLALQTDRRAKLVAMEQQFAMKTGRPWTSLRYFSSEEEADDHSARLTKLTGVAETGVTGFLFANLSAAETDLCKAALDAPSMPPPYGEYLIDEHHAACWRIAHARQVKAATSDRLHVPAPRAGEPWVPTVVSKPRPIY